MIHFSLTTTLLLFFISSQAQTIQVPSPELPPWCPLGVGCSSYVETQVNGALVAGNASLRLGQDGVFDRPVLLVEGFDFGSGWSTALNGHGSVTWNGIFGGDAVQFPMGLEYRAILDELYLQGADVVFLDFEFGTASLQHKAALLSFVMSLVLEVKEGQNPCLMVGVSMGGLIARIALANWEQEGQPHCYGQFHSIDAPHFGAIMPVGLQALVLALSNQSNQGALLWQALNSDAARQLLQHHISGGEEYQSAMAFLNTTGWPQSSLNLAVVNSRPDSYADLSDDPLLHMEWGLDGPLTIELAHVTADRWGGEGSQGGASLTLPGTLWPGDDIPLFESVELQFFQPDVDLEALPGATAAHLQLLANTLSASIPMDLLNESVQTDVTFVPWTSAMASSENCPEGPWTATSMATLSMPRETHASLPYHHREWMMSWIEALWDDEWPEMINGPDQTMTLGWNNPRHKIVHDILIASGGQLFVGNTENPFVAITSSCEGSVSVKNEGEMHIGSPQGAVGELSISCGTDLNIGMHGRVVVYEGSTLTVLPNAKLHVQGGSLDIRPGGRLVVLPAGRIVMEEGATVNVSGNATWIQSGQLNVLPGPASYLNLDGNMNWKSGSKMWLSDISECIWTMDDAACFQFDSDVLWSGNGQVKMEGGQGEFLQNGQLIVNVNVIFQDILWSGQNGEHPQLHSSKNVTMRECHLGSFRWHHGGNDDEPALILFEDNHWDVGWGELGQSRCRIRNNEFEHVSLRVTEALYPSRFVDNRWNQTWFGDSPALALESCQNPIWLESNSWQGGLGTHLLDANATFACNIWYDCTKAVLLEGEGESCFASQCGGGGNAWLHNDVHFRLLNSALPLISHGHNQLGPVTEQVASGITTTNVSAWHIEQAFWDISLLDNPMLSLLSTDVEYCNNDICTSVAWWADGIVLPQDCQEATTPKPIKEKSKLSGAWNVLGQETSVNPK